MVKIALKKIKDNINEGEIYNFPIVNEILRRIVTVSPNGKYFQFVFLRYDKNLNEYYLKHFKEIKKENGIEVDITDWDLVAILNVAKILADWDLINILEDEDLYKFSNGYKILKFFKILTKDESKEANIINPLKNLNKKG